MWITMQYTAPAIVLSLDMSEVPSHSREWLRLGRQNGPARPTVAIVFLHGLAWATTCVPVVRIIAHVVSSVFLLLDDPMNERGIVWFRFRVAQLRLLGSSFDLVVGICARPLFCGFIIYASYHLMSPPPSEHHRPLQRVLPVTPSKGKQHTSLLRCTSETSSPHGWLGEARHVFNTTD